MDYEKAYKEALERARANYKADKEMGFLENCDMLELIFPELAESEDERMIKAITHILYENYTDAAVIEGVEIAEIVTWLEKQKEKSVFPIFPEKENEVIEATKVHYVKEEVEKYEPEFVDWTAFRREAAKDILCALGSRMALGDDIVKISVEYADRLIEQLREEKK